AGRQLTVSRSIADSGAALVECRSAQLTDINNRLATASNDKDRKAIRRERTELTSALKKDIDLTGGVVDQHTNMAKTFTQGRAMTDGTSEAEVLGSQAPAYAAAPAVTKLSMPKGSGAGASGEASSAPPAAAPPELVTVKAAVVRSAPVASAAPVKSLPVGSALQARIAAADGGWWEVEVGGQTGYVRASEVGPPGSAPVQTAARGGARGKGAAARPAPPPPAPVGPSNIRAYNQSVIAARDNGKGRLSTLMTDIQTAERRESVLYAWLSNLGLG
ncbi:SH3 domain-containing protein, partial [Phenylobacterium sp. CCH9-H3]